MSWSPSLYGNFTNNKTSSMITGSNSLPWIPMNLDCITNNVQLKSGSSIKSLSSLITFRKMYFKQEEPMIGLGGVGRGGGNDQMSMSEKRGNYLFHYIHDSELVLERYFSRRKPSVSSNSFISYFKKQRRSRRWKENDWGRKRNEQDRKEKKNERMERNQNGNYRKKKRDVNNINLNRRVNNMNSNSFPSTFPSQALSQTSSSIIYFREEERKQKKEFCSNSTMCVLSKNSNITTKQSSNSNYKNRSNNKNSSNENTTEYKNNVTITGRSIIETNKDEDNYKFHPHHFSRSSIPPHPSSSFSFISPSFSSLPISPDSSASSTEKPSFSPPLSLSDSNYKEESLVEKSIGKERKEKSSGKQREESTKLVGGESGGLPNNKNGNGNKMELIIVGRKEQGNEDTSAFFLTTTSTKEGKETRKTKTGSNHKEGMVIFGPRKNEMIRMKKESKEEEREKEEQKEEKEQKKMEKKKEKVEQMMKKTRGGIKEKNSRKENLEQVEKTLNRKGEQGEAVTAIKRIRNGIKQQENADERKGGEKDGRKIAAEIQDKEKMYQEENQEKRMEEHVKRKKESEERFDRQVIWGRKDEKLKEFLMDEEENMEEKSGDLGFGKKEIVDGTITTVDGETKENRMKEGEKSNDERRKNSQNKKEQKSKEENMSEDDNDASDEVVIATMVELPKVASLQRKDELFYEEEESKERREENFAVLEEDEQKGEEEENEGQRSTLIGSSLSSSRSISSLGSSISSRLSSSSSSFSSSFDKDGNEEEDGRKEEEEVVRSRFVLFANLSPSSTVRIKDLRDKFHSGSIKVTSNPKRLRDFLYFRSLKLDPGEALIAQVE